MKTVFETYKPSLDNQQEIDRIRQNSGLEGNCLGCWGEATYRPEGDIPNTDRDITIIKFKGVR